MADRVLVWSVKRCDGDPTVMLPAYYMEAEYTPVAVRIHAEDAPDDGDAEFDIYDDGTSIMNDHVYDYRTYIANTATYTGTTKIHLTEGETSEDMAEDFDETVTIVAGSWITCAIKKDGGGKNFTVVLELNKDSESDEDSE